MASIETLINHKDLSIQIIGIQLASLIKVSDSINVNSGGVKDLIESILEAYDSAYKQGYEDASYSIMS